MSWKIPRVTPLPALRHDLRYLEDVIKLDELLPEDWSTLRIIHAFLEEIKETTKALESDNSTLEKVLPAMDFILERFEQAKDEYKDDPIMAPMFNSGWAKMEKYYTLTEESSAYIAALVLRPSYKWNYITKQWRAEWVTLARQVMQKLWTGEYKPQDSTMPSIFRPLTTANKFTIWSRKHEVSTNFDDVYYVQGEIDVRHGVILPPTFKITPWIGQCS